VLTALFFHHVNNQDIGALTGKENWRRRSHPPCFTAFQGNFAAQVHPFNSNGFGWIICRFALFSTKE